MGSYKIIPNVGKLPMKSIETAQKGGKVIPNFLTEPAWKQAEK